MGSILAISDHAIVRFLQRKHGITREEIMAELFGESVPTALPAGHYKRGEVWVVVEDNCIVTVLSDAEKRVRENGTSSRARRVSYEDAKRKRRAAT